ncbi:MAG: hypothetical protein V8R64_01420 [Thomasclavelia sp.]
MSLIQAKKYLKQFDRDQDIIEFDVSSATVELGLKPLILFQEESLKLIISKLMISSFIRYCWRHEN